MKAKQKTFTNNNREKQKSKTEKIYCQEAFTEMLKGVLLAKANMVVWKSGNLGENEEHWMGKYAGNYK
jgi:hypothetical protein